MEGNLQDYQEQFHSGQILGGHVMSTLAPTPGMRVLDLGCGDGLLTQQIAEAGADVIGVDVDEAFVNSALKLGVNAIVKDAHDLDFIDEFDRVFSNATLHWLSKDPSAVVRGVYNALHSGGKFVAEFGGHGNVSTIVTTLKEELQQRGYLADSRNPWYFPTSDEYGKILKSTGFVVDSCELVPALTPLQDGKDMSGWLRTFCSKWLHGIDEGVSASILESVCDRLAKTSLHKDGKWFVDYVRLRVVAQKPGMNDSLIHESSESERK